MVEACVEEVQNIFGFDLDFLPDTCKIYPTFKVKNYALNPVYVKAEVVSGRYDFNGSSYVELGKVDGASEKTFYPEMTASPLTEHTYEEVVIAVKIYKESTYSTLLEECQFTIKVYYLDKNLCTYFEENVFHEGDPEGWTLENLAVSDVADLDGSGYCLYGSQSGETTKTYRASKSLECGEEWFIGFAIGFKAQSYQIRFSKINIADQYITNIPLLKGKWGYVVVSLAPLTGNNTVKIEVQIYTYYSTTVYAKLYIDQIRHYKF